MSQDFGSVRPKLPWAHLMSIKLILAHRRRAGCQDRSNLSPRHAGQVVTTVGKRPEVALRGHRVSQL